MHRQLKKEPSSYKLVDSCGSQFLVAEFTILDLAKPFWMRFGGRKIYRMAVKPERIPTGLSLEELKKMLLNDYLKERFRVISCEPDNRHFVHDAIDNILAAKTCRDLIMYCDTLSTEMWHL